MDSRLITGLAVAGITVWTLIALGAWGLVDLGGGLLRTVFEAVFAGNPDAASAVSALMRFMEGLGGWLVGLAWLAGSAAIAVAAALFRQLAAIEIHAVHFGTRYERYAEREMKDVTPPRPHREEKLRLPAPGNRD